MRRGGEFGASNGYPCVACAFEMQSVHASVPTGALYLTGQVQHWV